MLEDQQFRCISIKHNVVVWQSAPCLHANDQARSATHIPVEYSQGHYGEGHSYHCGTLQKPWICRTDLGQVAPTNSNYCMGVMLCDIGILDFFQRQDSFRIGDHSAFWVTMGDICSITQTHESQHSTGYKRLQYQYQVMCSALAFHHRCRRAKRQCQGSQCKDEPSISRWKFGSQRDIHHENVFKSYL
jgi:hypothetical protein